MKRLRDVAIVLAIIVGIVQFVHYGPPRFWGDFTGMTEAKVRQQLAEPFRDNRDNKDKDVQDFTLGWYQGFQVGLFLEFEDGVVISQKRISR
jgi:hypothetical protein